MFSFMCSLGRLFGFSCPATTAESPNRVATSTTASEPSREGSAASRADCFSRSTYPDERPPGTRKKGTPEHDLGAVGKSIPKPPVDSRRKRAKCCKRSRRVNPLCRVRLAALRSCSPCALPRPASARRQCSRRDRCRAHRSRRGAPIGVDHFEATGQTYDAPGRRETAVAHLKYNSKSRRRTTLAFL